MDTTTQRPGEAFRQRTRQEKILPLIGIFDVFSARVAAARFDGVFLSGFGFSASAYGLPDQGYLNWRDIIDFAGGVRHVAPRTHMLVDIDDGFGDEQITANTVRKLESAGASAAILEDQKRPRRCGHYEGKEILPVPEYLVKLRAALTARDDLFVIGRTDATDHREGIERALQYAEAGADAVMVEAIRDLEVVNQLRGQIECPIVVNQIHGGKTPNWTFSELQDAGANIIIYSTPCLFSAQHAMERYLEAMRREERLPSEGSVSLDECTKVLQS